MGQIKDILVAARVAASFQEVIGALAAEDKKGITFIPGSSGEVFVSYKQLYGDALSVLYTLQEIGLRPGQELVIQVGDNRHFIILFWACLLGRIIPVPLSLGVSKEQKSKLLTIWKYLSDPYLVCDKEQSEKAKGFFEEEAFGRVVERTLFVEEVLGAVEATGMGQMTGVSESTGVGQVTGMSEKPGMGEPTGGAEKVGLIWEAGPDDIAYIQYSSGSTGEPKGVVLTHRNLLHNTADIMERSGITAADSLLSWMPLTHDMGLICCHLTGVLAGVSQYILPTQLFIRRPLLWFQKVNEHRVSILYSPNFGYHYFLSALDRNPEHSWDLSCVRLIYNGAEPIASSLCSAFTGALAAWQLGANTIFPGYGLAEASVAVTLPQPGKAITTYTLSRSQLNTGQPVSFLPQDDKDGIQFVETGFPLSSCRLRITDAAGADLPEDMIGHIQIKGQNVTHGYYNNAAATGKVFTGDKWLRTGDLGFLHEGNLVVTGREKNIIIINGQNYYPQDIERAAMKVEGISQGMVAACGRRSRDQAREELLLFVMSKRTPEENSGLIGSIRESISLHTGLVADKVIIVKQIPKTTSGKVQYFKLLGQYEEGVGSDGPGGAGVGDAGTGAVGVVAGAGMGNAAPGAGNAGVGRDLRYSLLKTFEDALGYAIPFDADLFALGINSMQASRVALALQQSTGSRVLISDIFQYPSPQKLYDLLSSPLVADEGNVVEKAAGRDDHFVPTPAQERFWVMNQYVGEPGALNIGVAFTITGRPDRVALQKAFDGLIERHESLRTNFMEYGVGGEAESGLGNGDGVESGLRMVVREFRERYSPITFIDLSKEKNRLKKARQTANDEVNRSFDLSGDPLIRITCLLTGEHTYTLVLVLHHIIGDGWSAEIILRELSLLYKEFQRGEEGGLAALSLQYKDYAEWFRHRLEAGKPAGDRAYWHEELKGELPFTSLPATGVRPAIRTFNGRSVRVSLPARLSQGLYELCRQRGTTLFPSLAALLHALFFKYTGQEESVIGTSTHGRTVKGAEEQIGYFLNTVILRNTVKGKDFAGLLEAAKEKVFRALEHQAYPFELLVEELELHKDRSRSPGFDVLLLLQNFGVIEELAAFEPGLPAKEFPLDARGCLVDLQFEFFEKQNGLLDLSIRYNTDLYEEWQIRQLVGHFETLAMQAIADPARLVSDLTILTQEEEHRLKEEFNGISPAGSFLPKFEESFLPIFKKQAALYPEKEAVVCGNHTLNYASLDSLSDRLAVYLRIYADVRPGELVGLMLRRSEHMIVSMLAVLKCGAAYLPIDPDYPTERILYIIKDSRVKALYTDRSSRDQHEWPEGDVSTFFREIFEEWTGGDGLPGHAEAGASDGALIRGTASAAALVEVSHMLPAEIAPSSLAYVMYTSGSTGRPKGVMIEHKALADYIRTFSEYFMISAGDVVMQQSSFSFDTSVEEIYPALCSGAKIVVLQEEGRNIDLLINTIKRQGVTILSATPLVINELNRRADDMKGLRCLISGGDILKPSYIDKLVGRTPIYNTYGPTETTVCASFHRIQSMADLGVIGRPIAHHQAYIVDGQLNLLPPGIPGEICISGAGLARGYIHDTVLTAGRFVDHPFIKGAKLYRTGDLGRWQPDGELVFCGRKDEQVKIRGYRVEPSEVAASLAQHESIKDAVVVNDSRGDLGNRLIAYYSSESPLDENMLRDFLSDFLPHYMIPQRLMHLLVLPRTVNGKIDRNALPAPMDVRSLADSGHGEGTDGKCAGGIDGKCTGKICGKCAREIGGRPSGKIEESLVRIWESVLGRSGIRVNENFFELGGQSIKAVHVLNKIAAGMQVRLSIRDLFREPTIARLAACIRGRDSVREAPIVPVATGEHYGLSNAQKRLWVLSQIGEQEGAYHLSMHFELSGPLDREAIKKAFQSIICRHESLRTVFITVDGEPRQKIVSYEELEFAVGQFDRRPDDIPGACFDLQKGPLLRASLQRLAKDKYIFDFTIHHIIADADSLELLAGELSAFYNGYVGGGLPVLPALPIQYKDYAAWHQERLKGPDFAAHSRFWKDQFGDGVPVLDLPADFPRPPIQEYQGAVIIAPISPRTRKGLEQVGQHCGASLFMVLLSAFNTLLYRYTGQDDIVVGSPVSGRDHDMLEGQVGFYINTLAIRTKLTGSDSFEQNLERIKDWMLEAYEHRAYPFDKLVSDLDLPRDLSRSPLFDIMVGFRESAHEDTDLLSFDKIKIRKVRAGAVASQFDLSVDFIAAGDKLDIRIEYNTGLFTGRWARLLLGHFKGMLSALLKDPGSVPIDKLDYLTLKESESLRTGFNPPARQYSDTPISLQFEEVVRKDPGAIALVYKDRVLSYDEVNRKANKLAHYLREEYHVAPGVTVGILSSRSENMVLFLLAVLKAGGAYIPVDENYPADRIRYIISDSGAGLILTDLEDTGVIDPEGARATDLAGSRAMDPGDMRNASTEGTRTLRITNWEGQLGDYPVTNPVCLNAGDDLAYIIYTSGSTGRPKGVMVEHRNLANISEGWKTAYKLGSFPLSLLQVASFSFDVFAGDICRALLNGGRLVICPHEARVDPELFYQLLREHRISVFESTPPLVLSVLKYIKEHGLDCSFLKLLIIGSDILSRRDYEKIVADFGDKTRIINSYGVTEATIDSSFYEGKPGAGKGWTAITPIGRPLQNTRFYILDKLMQPVPVGVRGELFIGGAGVARGYLNQPGLNAERFIADPFMAGERLFRTGDKAGWLPDGQVLFHGRQDEQIKLRGYRIEPGEIKDALLKIEKIADAWVAPCKDERGVDHLVAYICGEDLPAPAQIRSRLSEWLPPQMIPSFYYVLDRIPISPNGKIDRRALPEPEFLYEGPGHEDPDPDNHVEIQLQLIWQEVLEKEKIGVRDDFFQLGGHSLKAIKLLYRIERVLHIQTDLRTLFTHPTIRSLAAKIGVQSPARRSDSIVRLASAADYEVSGQQRSLWILEQSNGAQAAYTMPGAYHFAGQINTNVFKRAIDALLQRHESLRSRFLLVKGELRQTVKDLQDSGLPELLVDLREHGDPGAAVKENIEAVIQARFDLEKDALVRFRLLQTGDDRYVFLFAMHHIISDGWSLDVLVNDLVTLYNAFLKDAPNPLPDLTFQQKDIIAWNNKRGAAGLLEQNRLFWLEELAGELPVLEMPVDFSRPRQKTFRGSAVSFLPGQELSRRLRDLAEQQDTSLYMILLAITHALIYKYTGRQDIITGTAMAGRPVETLYDQIGYYVNTLPLRVRFAPDDNFTSLLHNVKDRLLGVFDHQSYSLDMLVEDLQVRYDAGRNPLFEVLTVFQETDVKGKRVEELDGVVITEYPVEMSFTKFDLTFNFFDTAEGIRIELEYSTDLFTAGRMESLLKHFGAIAKSVVVSPSQKLNKLVYLSGLEVANILSTFNRTKTLFPIRETIVGLFERQVAKTPDATAVISADGRLSYKQLNERANRLARHLRSAHHVGKGDIVAIHLEPGIDLLVAIYGTLKAGAAYLPVDPGYPEERKSYMLRDSGSRLMLAGAGVSAPGDIACVRMDDRGMNGLDDRGMNGLGMNGPDGSGMNDLDGPRMNSAASGNLPLQSGPEDLIYMIYTSGTTGRPKGVLIEHHSVVNLASWLIDMIYIHDSRPLCALLTASISFDASVQQLFAPLLCGSCLVTVTDEVKKDPGLFLNTIKTAGVDILDITPSYLKALLSYMKDRDLTVNVKYTLIGGEQITPEIMETYPLFFGRDSRLINVYGVTEVTVDSTYALADPAKNFRDIGRPLPNTRIYILDGQMNVLPVGIPGELYIGGEGLSRGYHNNRELTNAKFIVSPFENHIRLYRTGDIACWTAEGTIEWLGRADAQIKIRGYRIEPEEISATVLKYEGIDDAVVLAKKPDGKQDELALYYTGPAEIPVRLLRTYLAAHLPPYMIPGYFVYLPAFPKTGSGKLDIRSLPSPLDGPWTRTAEYKPPVTVLQQRLSMIWQDLLKADRIGLDDNFFDRGGHSLKATQLVSRIYKEMNVELPLKSIFLHPTISEMAGLIRDSVGTFARYEDIPLLRDGINGLGHFEVSPVQERFWILSQLNDEHIAYNIVSAFDLEGKLDEAAFAESLRRLVQRHEILRTSFLEAGEDLRQKISDTADPDDLLFMTDLRHEKESGEQKQGFIASEIRHSFDFTKGPLIRCRLLKWNEDRYTLIFNIHHIVSDGWSTQVIINDLITFYNHISHRQELSLPPLSIQYKEYVQWQRLQMGKGKFAAHRDYWMDLFRTKPAVLPLDLDFPRPAIKTFNGANCVAELVPENPEGLVKFTAGKGVTLFMLLIASVKTLLYRYTGSKDILIGSAVAGRDHPELSGQVGCYVNTIVLRSAMKGEERFDDFLQRIKGTILDAFEHQSYPFDKLVDELRLPRDLSRSPLFDTMITLENTESRGKDLTAMQGVDIKELAIPDTFCKFDLSFNFIEKEGRLILSVEYNKDLFLPGRIAAMCAHLGVLLQSILRDSAVPIRDLDYLPEAEKKQLLLEFNDTERPYPAGKTLQELFEERVAAFPHLPALQYQELTYTYAQLNEKVNRLAHYLLDTVKIRAGDPVGIMMEKSHRLIVAIWAVLKAGGAYVPIDPAYPEERKKFLLQDSDVRVLLIARNPRHDITVPDPGNGIKDGVVIDIDHLQGMDLSSVNPPVQVTSDHPAYIIYTSGTTGYPKGVPVRQSAVVNLSQWLSDLVYSRHTRPLKTMLTASYSFDSSVKQIFPPLLSGSCLVILPEDKKYDVQAFMGELLKYRIDMVDITPTYLGLLLASIGKKLPVRGPEYFICGGEALTQDTVGQFYRAFGPASRLINVYGVTEATVDSTFEIVPVTGRTRASIGAPVSNTQIYILDEHLQLLPVGAAGEICIAGEGVASGYLHRPELTAKKFCKNPYQVTGNLYRTGDLGKWLPEGNIEYLGRKDQQVKIAGHRIEPGEIEQTLAAYPGIEKAVVIAKKDLHGENRLIAYYTGLAEIRGPQLRQYLAGKLPVYMLPGDFNRLETFPVTAHGKLDLQALPDPIPDETGVGDEGESSAGTTEKGLEQLWIKVLGRTRIGVHENFFEIGGNSLKVIRLYHAIRENYPVAINVHQLFSHATIARQSAFINGLLYNEDIPGPEPVDEIREIEF